MKEMKIYEFDPVIYPTRLWVCINPEWETIQKIFYFLNADGEVIDAPNNPFNTGSFANTIRVGKKKDYIRGCLISILRPSETLVGVCSHEAFHYVMFLMEYIGINCESFENSEPTAYLEQWATNCVWNTLKGHPEIIKGKLLEEK